MKRRMATIFQSAKLARKIIIIIIKAGWKQDSLGNSINKRMNMCPHPMPNAALGAFFCFSLLPIHEDDESQWLLCQVYNNTKEYYDRPPRFPFGQIKKE